MMTVVKDRHRVPGRTSNSYRLGYGTAGSRGPLQSRLDVRANPTSNRAVAAARGVHRGLWTTLPLLTERPTLSHMSSKRIPDDDFYIDANGCLTERVNLGGQDVIVHYDDIPESDVTSINGIRCTTALRTVIDLAPELEAPELRKIVRDCLDRRLFTPEEAMARIAKPDMLNRPGARLLRQVLGGPSGMA